MFNGNVIYKTSILSLGFHFECMTAYDLHLAGFKSGGRPALQSVASI